jgi:hypothetical protein
MVYKGNHRIIIIIAKMEQFKKFKSFDFHEKSRLNDNDFDAWFNEIGLK